MSKQDWPRCDAVCLANDYRDRIEALERELAGVREGTHVIVPKEPTKRMEIAAINEWQGPNSEVLLCDREFVANLYRAAIAAAPEKAQEEKS